MNKVLITIRSFFLLLITFLVIYSFHLFVLENYFSYISVPVLSIYLFNFFSVSIFLILFRININHQYFSPIVLFIALTLVKMIFVVLYFIILVNHNVLEIINIVYNFFPVYFLFLLLEVILLKKWLNTL